MAKKRKNQNNNFFEELEEMSSSESSNTPTEEQQPTPIEDTVNEDNNTFVNTPTEEQQPTPIEDTVNEDNNAFDNTPIEEEQQPIPIENTVSEDNNAFDNTPTEEQQPTPIEDTVSEDNEVLKTQYKSEEKGIKKVINEIKHFKDLSKNDKIKYGFFAIGGSILFYYVFLNDTKSTATNNPNENQIKTNFSKKEEEITYTETMTNKELFKDQNFAKILKELRRDINNLKNKKDTTNVISIEQLMKKQYESFKEIENYMFKKKYNIGEFEYYEKKGDSILHYINKEDQRNISDKVVFPFIDGMIIKIPDIEIIYVLVKEKNQKEKINYYSNDFKIWKIDNTVGLKQIISSDEKRQTLSFLKEGENNPDFIYERFRNKIVIIGKNLEIEERINIITVQNKDQIEEPKNILEVFNVIGYMDKLYNQYIIKNGKITKDDKVLNDKVEGINFKLKKYQTEDLEEKYALLQYQNKTILGEESLDEIRKVLLSNYKGLEEGGKKEIEYIEKNQEVFKVTETNDLYKVGDGYIVGKIKDGKLTNVTLDLFNEIYEALDITQFYNKVIVLANGEEYKITEEGTISNLGTFYKLEEIIVGSNEYLYINKKKIGKITVIKTKGKTGVKVTTKDYNIIIRKEDDFEIRDKVTKDLKYSNISLEGSKIKFLITEKDNSITAYIKEEAKINIKDKTINGIKYATYEQKEDGTFIIYNDLGEKVQEVLQQKEVFLFKQKIEDFELTEGDLFEYFFEMDNRTGKVSSNTIGAMIKKYKTNEIPFKGFKKGISQKKVVNITKSYDLKKGEMVDLKTILRDNLSKFSFSIVGKKEKLQILDDKAFMFDGSKRILLTKSFYNKKFNEFIIIFNKKVAKQRDLKSLGFDVNLDKEKLKVEKVEYEVEEFMIPNKNQVVLKFAKNLYFKEGSNPYELIINKEVSFLDNEITIYLEKNGMKSIKINEIKELFPYLKEKYKKEIKLQFTPKKEKRYESDFEKLKDQIIEEQTKTFNSSLEKLKAELSQMMKKPVKPKEIKLSEEKIESIVKEEQIEEKDDFMFEIGSKLKLKIPESIEMVEGEKPFVLGYISYAELSDMEGNMLTIDNAKVKLEIKADFTKQKVFINPVEIIYIHPELNKKVKLKIPSSATQFLYKERDKKTGETYKTVGIPGYVIRAKLKTLPTRVVLQTVGGAIENLTKTDDPMAGMADMASSLSDPTASDTGESSESMGESAASGVSEGIKEIVDSMKELAEAEKDVIITEPNIVGEVLFLEEVSIKLEENNSTKTDVNTQTQQKNSKKSWTRK